jgi:hypothetical protein
MPANWDPSQNLNGTRVEWPQGPLEDEQGVPHEAWVMQDTTKASQRTVQTGPWAPGRWTADGDSRENGSFEPGLALGIALLAYHDGTKETHNWWLRVVDLY